MIGQVVGQYRFVEKLGEGGMGTVYKGIDMMVEREVAIKMLRPEIAHQPELVDRFRAEAITLAKLNSPGIATLYNFFREGEDYFMVMELLAGRTLEHVLKQSGPMSWERGVPLFCQILESIEPAHRAGILHRDIKPANIMLTERGTVKVMDFGIARVLGAARVTRVGSVIGTLEYIPPERILGSEADVRADIYSLGVVLYEMLSCRLPFESPNQFEMMRRQIDAAPKPFANYGVNVPTGIERVVLKSLAKRPQDRYAACSEMEAALRDALEAAGGQRAMTPNTAPSWNRGLGDLGGEDASRSAATVAPVRRSVFGRLGWKHYIAAAFLALALGGGAMFIFYSAWGGGSRPSGVSGDPRGGARVAQSNPAASASQVGPDSHATDGSLTDADAKAREKAQAADQQRRREESLKALDEN